MRLRAFSNREGKAHLLAFFLIMLLAIAARLPYLFQPIRYDESWNFLWFGTQSIKYLVSHYLSNNHVFSSLLMHWSYRIFGDGVAAIRLPALLAGILVVPTTYFLVHRLYDRDSALLAMGLTASSSFLIEYSDLARGYTILILFFLLTLIFATYLVNEDNLAMWILFVLCSSLGFFTIVVYLYPFGVVTIWLFFSILHHSDREVRRRRLIHFFAALLAIVALTFLLYLPIMIKSGPSSLLQGQSHFSRSWGDFVKEFPRFASDIWRAWNRDLPAVLSAILITGLIVSLLFNRRISSFRLSVFIPAIIWVPTVVLVQRVILYPRFVLFLLPIYLGMASAGICFLLEPVKSRLGRMGNSLIPFIAVVLSVALCIGVFQNRSIEYSPEVGNLKEAVEITEYLKENLRPGDRVVAIIPSTFPLYYYFPRYGLSVDCFHADPYGSERLLILANNLKPFCQTWEGVLEVSEICLESLSDFTLPEELKRFDTSVIYEMRRTQHLDARSP